MRDRLKDIKGFYPMSNRFVLFDKNGKRLNGFALMKQPDFLELPVLETKESGYQSLTYFVGFATLHIKLDYENEDMLDKWNNLTFGETEIDRGH